MIPVLIVTTAKHRGAPVPIESDLFLIGSNPECQLKINHPDVAGEHCAVIWQGIGRFISVLSDRPATTNDRELLPGEERPLLKGDRLKVGPLEFLFEEFDGESPEELRSWAMVRVEQADKPAIEDHEDDEDDDDDEQAEAEAAERAAEEVKTHGRLSMTPEKGRLVVHLHTQTLTDETELAALGSELRGLLDRMNLKVVIDFKAVKRLSPTAAVLFADLSGELCARGGALALCRLLPDHQGMMRPLSTLARVRFFVDVPAALAGTW